MGDLSDAELVLQAGKVLGAPPRKELFSEEEHWKWLIPVLKNSWLPTLSKVRLEQIAMWVTYDWKACTKSAPGGQSNCLSFLVGRKANPAYRQILRKAFIESHQTAGASRPRKPKAEKQPKRTLIVLKGRGEPPAHAPWDHQQEVWDKLDDLRFGSDDSAQKSGLVVLPTGSGKTDVAVTWLLRDALRRAPRKRVLWLAHQQEWLEQALTRFEALVCELPRKEQIRVRLCHSGAAPVTTLAEKSTDVALVTIQSLAKDFEAKKLPLLKSFVQERPTIIIIDEAHHAGSETYHRVLSATETKAVGVLGLTATPAPMSQVGQVRLKKHFPPPPLAESDIADLVQRQILARMDVAVIPTSFEVKFSPEELKILEQFPDIRPDILARLDDVKRNSLIVKSYLDNSDLYGKTLVYATNIDHADRLTALFVENGVEAKVLHSKIDDRKTPLKWFRSQKHAAVLVSVGMLTEGVDLPDAQTVFLGRPTTSRVLLRQMIGRAMRGPLAGGGPVAYVVSFQDYWQRFSGVLAPEDVLEGEFEEFDPETGTVRPLPKLFASDGQAIPAYVAAQIKRMINSLPYDATVFRSPLAGWYKLESRSVAVLEHQREAFRRFIEDADKDLKGTPPHSYFADVPDPVPARRDLIDLRDFFRLNGVKPEFEEVRDESMPQDVAIRIRDAGALTIEERHQMVAEAYDRGISRLCWPTLDSFESSVDNEIKALVNDIPSYDGSIRAPETTFKRPLIPNVERDLAPLVADVKKWASMNLEPRLRAKLATLPPVHWSQRVVDSYFGHFVFKRMGKDAGKTKIVINRLLSTRKSIIKDDTLRFLIYHEVLHHLLPFSGHDTHFRSLEAKWPGALEAEAELDTLADQWEVRAERYSKRKG